MKKKRTCLGCGKLFDSNDAGHRICGPCKSRQGRPPTILDYGQDHQTITTKSRGKPLKWR